MSDPLRFPSPDPGNERQLDRPMAGLEPLPGESPMWFRRFVLYRDLGYKRSLRKAVAAERARVRVVEATKGDEKESSRDVALSEQVLKSVAPSSVPGSWQHAAARFHWQERAAAYERFIIHKMAEDFSHQLQLTYANRFKRIMALNEMIEHTIENSKNARYSYPIEDADKLHRTMLGYTKELRALLADLRIETQGIDEQALQASIEANALAERQRQIDQADRKTDRTVIHKG